MLDDDDLPGEPGDLEHSYINMRVQNMTLISKALGGDPTLLEGIETRNLPDTMEPFSSSRASKRTACNALAVGKTDFDATLLM